MANGVGELEPHRIVLRLGAQAKDRTEADIQSDIRALLLSAELELDDVDVEVKLEAQAGDGLRIDVQAGFTVIEVKKNLRRAAVLVEAQEQLAVYLGKRETQTEQTWAGILTDGVEWRLYRRSAKGKLVEVGVHELNQTKPDAERLLAWLGSVLSTQQKIIPSPEQVDSRLGAGSPTQEFDLGTLGDLWESAKGNPEVQLKRHLWAKLLTTALGTAFEDDDDLFLRHTYLVLIAEVIAHEVVGLASSGIEPADLVSGKRFSEKGVKGVVEADFFDWVVEPDGGAGFVRTLAHRVSRFDWQVVEHDVLKHLYQSVIDDKTRKRLGEYYTPDWLAETIVNEVVDDPLRQRVLDPSCGSGTFVFHAVRRYLTAAEEAGIANREAISGLVEHVSGIDLHPVAVALARTTYLLAIGVKRLQNRVPFTVPVYLGDSLQWELYHDLLSPDGISIKTNDDKALFAERLIFPPAAIQSVERFESLLTALVDKATTRVRGSAKPKIESILKKYGLKGKDAKTLESTFSLLCDLHDNQRNHVWGYYVRNLARPYWLTQPEGRADRLVGNPPWLSYRYMTKDMQETFKKRCEERNLWAGGKVATHQDLSGYFVARCAELYLHEGGKVGFVMPLAALSRSSYEGFRSGAYGTFAIKFETAWDLEQITPQFFPVPSSVVFGTRYATSGKIPSRVNQWSGKLLSTGSTRSAEAAENLKQIGVDRVTTAIDDESHSEYAPLFHQGATIVPRMLHVVERVTGGDLLGMSAGTVRVRSARSSIEKEPWKSLESLEGTVEEQFLSPLHLGSTIAPFRALAPWECVLPCDDDGPRSLDEDREPFMYKRWEKASGLWDTHKSKSTKLSLMERIDYQSGLNSQFPIPSTRIVYTTSGTILAASIVKDDRTIIDSSLYWSSVSEDEGRYLEALLNAPVTTERVAPFQSKGNFGPRHFHKYVWRLRFPLYDSSSPLHNQLVQMAVEAEEIAAAVPIPAGLDFKAARKKIRLALDAEVLLKRLDEAVVELLDGSAT